MQQIDVSKVQAQGKFDPECGYWTCIGSIDGLLVWLEDDDLYYREVAVVTLDNRRVMTMDLTRHNKNSNVWKVAMVSVGRKYQGHGLAPKIYSMLVRNTEMVLGTATLQSPGGRKIWYDLARNPHLRVTGWVGKRNPVPYDIVVDRDTGEVSCDEMPVYGTRMELTLEPRV